MPISIDWLLCCCCAYGCGVNPVQRACTDFPKKYLAVAFNDDFNIPESGNRIPDLLDEIKRAIERLKRMQNEDSSMLPELGAASASPPSA